MGSNAIVCVDPWGRLKVGNRYVWVLFHEYCGPSFYTDAAMSKLYDPNDENDPVWPQFERWLKKYRAAKDKQQRTRAAGVMASELPPIGDVVWTTEDEERLTAHKAGVSAPDHQTISSQPPMAAAKGGA
jgi:hypothetical protein